MVYCDHIINHADGYFGTEINTPSTTGTFFRINLNHLLPPLQSKIEYLLPFSLSKKVWLE
jgi:hypothetical protein